MSCWSIASGNRLGNFHRGTSIEPIILFLIIFWTPSHFWALSLYKSDDYKKAVPYLLLIAGTEKQKKIFLFILFPDIPVVSSPSYFQFASLVYTVPALLMTFYYVYICYRLLKTKIEKKKNLIAKRIFVFSIFYLFSLFLLILLDNFFMRFYG